MEHPHEHEHEHEHTHEHTHAHDELTENDRSNAVRSADDTGMISGEAMITLVEIEHPEAFEERHEHKK
jgi:hypothetical protein